MRPNLSGVEVVADLFNIDPNGAAIGDRDQHVFAGMRQVELQLALTSRQMRLAGGRGLKAQLLWRPSR